MSARTETVTIGNVLAAHASQFAYSEAADRAEIWDLTYPELLARLAAGESITGDCSSTYEAVCKWAGAPLGPLGYTGTELDDMPHIELADALDGDAIVFGAFPGLHVVWKTGGSAPNPTIDSHGQPGFQQTTLQTMWDSVFPGQPITVLSLKPFLPPTPSGVAKFSGSIDLSTGKWTIKHQPGTAKYAGPSKEFVADIQVQVGAQGGGTWRVKGVPSATNEAPSVDAVQRSGIARFSGTVDLTTGKWMIKGEPGSAKFAGPNKLFVAQIEVQVGSKDGGTWKIKGLPS